MPRSSHRKKHKSHVQQFKKDHGHEASSIRRSSSFPVFTGWYFIFKKNFNDKFYSHIFNIYLVCNAFWILIIRANFSNRFAYLSWFLMSLIIIYPFLKQQFFKKQELVIAKVTLFYYGFTFLMFFVYYLWIKAEQV